MRLLHAALAAAALLSLAACASTEEADEADEDGGGEKPVAAEAVPEAVRRAAEAAVPGIRIERVTSETEDGKEYYEVAGTAGGDRLEVIVTPAGEVEVVERRIAPDSVPAAVRDAVQKRLPGFVADRAERLEKKSGATYEVRGKVGGKVCEVVVSAAGEILEIED